MTESAGRARLIAEKLRSVLADFSGVDDDLPLQWFIRALAVMQEAAEALAGQEEAPTEVVNFYPRDEDGDLVVSLRGVPNWSLSAHGKTRSEALANLAEVVRLCEESDLPAAKAEEDAPAPPRQDLMDSLHAVFTRHGIASRSDLPHALISDLVMWAARKCREAMPPAPRETREEPR
jgi:predicted RNase H-like HicB family nuclease